MASSRPLRGILKKSSEDGTNRARNGANNSLSWGECPTLPRDGPPGALAAERELWIDAERLWREGESDPPTGCGGGVLGTGGLELEPNWNWFRPDVQGLLNGLYPLVAEKLLELTEFEFTVSIPLDERRRKVELGLVERRKNARVALEAGEVPEHSEWELKRKVSDLMEVDAEVQELHRVAVQEVGHLEKRLGCGRFAK